MTDSDIEELNRLCSGVQELEEGGSTYIFLPALALPPQCIPANVDALLRISSRVINDYPTRLFFAQRITFNKTSALQLNWNANNVVILQRTWHAFSWAGVNNTGRMVEVLAQHLGAFK